MKRLEQVQAWLFRIDAFISEVDELMKRSRQEVERLCFHSCCSKKCKLSYVFGRQVAKRLEEAFELKQKGDFKTLVERELTKEPAYAVQLKINFETLCNEREELSALKVDVIRRVEVEEAQHKRRLEQVRVWISRVEVTIGQVDELLRDGQLEIDKACLEGSPSNDFPQLVAKKLKDVVSLKENGRFSVVAEWAPLDLVIERPSEPVDVVFLIRSSTVSKLRTNFPRKIFTHPYSVNFSQ